MEKVLVTAIGSFSADAVISSLKKIHLYVIGCDIYSKELLVNAGLVDDFFVAPKALEDNYIAFIKSVCAEKGIKYVFPLTDVEIDVLNENREWFTEHEICICMSSKKTIDICRNKKRFEEIVKHYDVATTIPTQNFYFDMPIPQFPVICKPINGRSSNGITYIEDNNEWNYFCARSSRIDYQYIVQPVIKGEIVTVDVVRQPNGEKSVAIPRLELLRTSNGAGLSVYVFKDEKLIQICQKIANIIDVVGCVNFEFIKDNLGQYHLLECNPRFAGGVAFSIIAGYDCVKNHLKCFQKGEIDDFQIKNNRFIARKYVEYETKIE